MGDTNPFQCACGKSFKSNSGLWKHKNKCDKAEKDENKPSGFNPNRCGEHECQFSYLYIEDLRKHLRTTHDVETELSELEFKNREDFLSWKENFEKETISYFLRRKEKKLKEHTVEYFYCSRSGKFKTESTGKRKMKSQNTCKINENCTASMKVVTRKDETLLVKVYKTHYGHEMQMGHLRLPKADRENFAAELLNGVQKKKILDSLFAGNSETLERKHLLQKKDLNNICTTYGVEKVERHAEDHISIEAYVNDDIQSGTGAVLLYKRQRDNYHFHPEKELSPLKEEDFALVIMTDFQKKMLKKFGKNIICLDATHSTNAYHFNLVTVMVLDDYHEGIAVAWLVSNKEDGCVLKLFLNKIKNAVGIINPNVIMTDKTPQYYNSWVEVFGGNPQKLLCIWHVIKDINQRLQHVTDQVIQKETHGIITLLLEEQDKTKFEIILANFLNSTDKDDAASVFRAYFVKEWAFIKEQWARCYRMGAGINTNMHLESFHKKLKYWYLEGKLNRRVDKLLVTLLDISRDQTRDRLIKLEKGKTTKKMTEIHKRHRLASKLPLSLVKKESAVTWNVTSAESLDDVTTASDNYIYKVEKKNSLVKKNVS